MNDWKQKIKIRLPALVLLLASLLFWGFYDRYESAGPVLLASPSLSDATRLRGDCTETNGHFVLRVPRGGKTASIHFRMPEAAGCEMVRVRGRIKVDGVVEGKYSWNCARLLLTQYNEKNQRMPGHDSLKSESGSKDWMPYDDIFMIIPEAAYVDMVVQQTGLSGTVEFDRLEVMPVQFRFSFTVWRIVFSSLWLFMAILFFRRCRLDRRKLRVLILLNAMVILTGTLMPGTWIESVTMGMKEAVSKTIETARNVSPSSEKSVKTGGQKKSQIDAFNEFVGGAHRLGHFLLFGSLCFLVYLSAALERQHPIYFIKVAFDLLLFAVISESLQYLTIDRVPGISDWLTDVYGILSAFLLFLTVLAIHRAFSNLGKGKVDLVV